MVTRPQTSLALLVIAVINQSSNADLSFEKRKPKPTPYQDWDYLIYSQHWPVTTCLEWEEKNQNNKCSLPPDPSAWTVHGIWPTKIGTEGPNFCDSAIHFDMDQLQPILADLNKFWTNLEANTPSNSLWKHEWTKHGTCASILPQLNSVINYFKQGLMWNQQYRLAQILATNKIVPNSQGYMVENIFDTIKGVNKKNPAIQCVIDGDTKKSLISEIRICFDKNLELIDCNVANPSVTLFNDEEDVLSNCNLKEPVMYYRTVPNSTYSLLDLADRYDELYVQECLENWKYNESLLNFYNVLKFLIWFTL